MEKMVNKKRKRVEMKGMLNSKQLRAMMMTATMWIW
jgi:hypothetical protein